MEAFEAGMILTSDHFKLIKKVDDFSFKDFKPFHSYPRLDLPVFFHSVLEMIGMGKFYWVIINDCLVVFRVSTMYGNYSCIVYTSPISLNNDVRMERVVVAALLEAGFSMRLTGGEVRRLNLNLKKVKAHKDSFPNEFIYKTKDVIEMQGSKYSALRTLVRRFNSRGGYVQHQYDNQVLDFVSGWAKMKKIRYTNFLNYLRDTDANHLFATTLYLNGNIQGFTVLENVGRFYHATVIVPNHNSPFDIVPALHYYSAINLPNKDTYINSGAGSVGGLDFQKRRLRPAVEEVVYRIPAIGNIKNAYSLVKDFL